ncbi:acyloxyacyl hydrolase [Noviherbaspirillum saxi]|uniref:Acyloxyacyl hydrolase n=2 Tax=Noviherbaspirillum saxi TaxID=2320863 RepID=A0A3A3FUZ8_9BURK|nr:acyloxyacyl hydrolase [Noviherbaspirillum saxi]RJF99623.1 acyloxyacyl hydrolase [Noviherbaspirillum saxi]
MQSATHAVDSASLEIGSGNKTQLARVGLQWKWDSKWWQSNGTHIGGHWDLTLSQWRADRFHNIPGNSQNLIDIGFTPVFRLQNDNLKGWYLEGGIGAHYLSKVYDNNDRQFSTKFQFGDHLGVGYVFLNNLDVGLKIQHFSNGSFKQPNDGTNFAVLRASYAF